MNNKEKYTPEARARASAIGSLAMREHGCEELRHKLIGKGHDVTLVDKLIIQLLQECLISDARYAESYWRSRGNKGFGPARITRELEMKGVSSEVIEAARIEADLDFYQIVEAVYHKKYRRQAWQEYKEKAKRQSFLYRRGFDTELIKHAFASAKD